MPAELLLVVKCVRVAPVRQDPRNGDEQPIFLNHTDKKEEGYCENFSLLVDKASTGAAD